MDKLSINVSCGKKNKIFSCSKDELISQIKQHFSLSRDLEFYRRFKGRNEKIELQNIKDLMAIEVVPKKRTRSAVNGHPKFSEDYEVGESSHLATYHEQMYHKLFSNKTLTGKERKDVINMIQSRRVQRISRKRKRKEKIPKSHKKVQVVISNLKDSHAQTDPSNEAVLNGEENHNSSTTENDVILRMKKMAAIGKNKNAAVLMQETYNERRGNIQVKRMPVRLLKETYPLLFSLKEVKNELERIFSFGKCRDFLRNVQKFSPCILQNADRKSSVYNLATRSIQNAQSEELSQYAMQVGGLLLLPLALREEASFLRLKDQPHTCGEFPYIYAPTMDLEEVFLLEDTSEYTIRVERVTLCGTKSFTEAVLCLVASFYIFNINYTPETFRTYVAMEKLFLEGNETEEVDTFTSQMIKYFKLKAKCL